jgi:hypothetical protein
MVAAMMIAPPEWQCDQGRKAFSAYGVSMPYAQDAECGGRPQRNGCHEEDPDRGTEQGNSGDGHGAGE